MRLTVRVSNYYLILIGFNIVVHSTLTLFYHLLELQLMFKLMDRVPEGIAPMLDDLVDHILQAGLDDMLASADIITQVNIMLIPNFFKFVNCKVFILMFFFFFCYLILGLRKICRKITSTFQPVQSASKRRL